MPCNRRCCLAIGAVASQSAAWRPVQRCLGERQRAAASGRSGSGRVRSDAQRMLGGPQQASLLIGAIGYSPRPVGALRSLVARLQRGTRTYLIMPCACARAPSSLKPCHQRLFQGTRTYHALCVCARAFVRAGGLAGGRAGTMQVVYVLANDIKVSASNTGRTWNKITQC